MKNLSLLGSQFFDSPLTVRWAGNTYTDMWTCKQCGARNWEEAKLCHKCDSTSTSEPPALLNRRQRRTAARELAQQQQEAKANERAGTEPFESNKPSSDMRVVFGQLPPECFAAVQEAGGDTAAMFSAADRFLVERRYQQAESILQILCTTKPNDARLRACLGMAIFEFENARAQDYQKSHGGVPGTEVRQLIARMNEARGHLQVACELDPNDTMGWTYRGACLMMIGQYARDKKSINWALNAYRRALEIESVPLLAEKVRQCEALLDRWPWLSTQPRTRTCREVTFVIRHIHKTEGRSRNDELRGADWDYKVYYNTFSAKAAVPVDGLKRNNHEIYCPYCNKPVPLLTSSDKMFALRRTLAWSILAVPFLIIYTLWLGTGSNDGEGILVWGGIGALAFDFFVLVPIAGVIEGSQFRIGDHHGHHEIESFSPPSAPKSGDGCSGAEGRETPRCPPW